MHPLFRFSVSEVLMSVKNVPLSAGLSLEVLQQFRVIFGTMRRHFREVEERCGLPGSQMWLLQEVQRCPGIGVSELAICLGIHQSTCSLLVDKLVARRFLKKTRKPSDRRCVGLALDEEAEKVLALLPGPAEGSMTISGVKSGPPLQSSSSASR